MKNGEKCMYWQSVFQVLPDLIFDMILYRTCYLFPSLIVSQLAPTGSPSLVNSMKVIQNPVQTCDKVYALIQSLTSQIRKRLEDPKSAGICHTSIEVQVYRRKNIQLGFEKKCSKCFSPLKPIYLV